jgi:hypothetical protein
LKRGFLIEPEEAAADLGAENAFVSKLNYML